MSGNTKEVEPKVKKTRFLPASKEPKTNNPMRSRPLIPALSLLIALGALGTAAYTLISNQQVHTQLSDVDAGLSTQSTQLAEAQKHMGTQINRIEANEAGLKTALNHLSQEVHGTLNQAFYENHDWLLLKARHCLELAQINAHWDSDSHSAIALMEQADYILKNSNDPKLITIRQLIAKDIEQLQALPQVDRADLLNQLDAVQNDISGLTMPLPTTDASPTTSTSASKTSDWHTHLEESMNVLEKLIVVRHHDEDIQPLMSPLLEALLKEKLALNLQEAQWAVLRNNSTIYQLVLKQTIDTLKKNFNEHAPNTALAIKKLTKLQQIKLAQVLPTIDSALPLLNELIDAKKEPMNQPRNHEQKGIQ